MLPKAPGPASPAEKCSYHEIDIPGLFLLEKDESWDKKFGGLSGKRQRRKIRREGNCLVDTVRP